MDVTAGTARRTVMEEINLLLYEAMMMTQKSHHHPANVRTDSVWGWLLPGGEARLRWVVCLHAMELKVISFCFEYFWVISFRATGFQIPFLYYYVDDD